MSKISVGLTTTGKAIMIDSKVGNPTNIAESFKGFSEREAFDALLGVEYLLLSENRRNATDSEWLESIQMAQAYLSDRLDRDRTNTWKVGLMIDSAFKARSYGKKRIHPHFRHL